MLYLFGGALAVVILYSIVLRWGWRRSLHATVADSPDELPPLSVVVAARNEEATLPNLFDALDKQTHPSFEVVIVDDASTDETKARAEEWASGRSDVSVVTVTDPSPPRKKHALSKGIRAARHDLLAFTDADCAPPMEWLSVIGAAHASVDEDLVLVGYSPLRGSGLLGLYSRYETLLHALYTTAAIGLNRPYMAVGRNLSYPRSVFEAVDGFSHSQQSMSGDDDLFVQAVRRSGTGEVRALLDKRSFVPSGGPSSWREWIRRRRRHVSAGRHYDFATGLHLTLLHLSLVLLWISPLFLGTLGAGLLATALLARHSSLGRAAEVLHETDVLAVFPVWEFGYVLYHVIVVPLGLLFPPTEW